MTKKLDAEKHVVGFFTTICSVIVFSVLAYTMYLIAGLMSILIFPAISLLITFPWWFSCLWNRFIADEEEYYK